MARIDRRQRLALDESYRYLRSLQAGETPELFKLSRSLNNINTALLQSEFNQFKLTRQLWKRVQEGLFETYITSFPGSFTLRDVSGRTLETGQKFPEAGTIHFRPSGCKRNEDSASLPLKQLFRQTQAALKKKWSLGQTQLDPSSFDKQPACEDGICPVRPVVLGEDVLSAESKQGKQQAYQQWWELYWQAYCTKDKSERAQVLKSMMALEAIWGDLYY